jgi:uncharacterized membrane protein affecting hemolysin expression
MDLKKLVIAFINLLYVSVLVGVFITTTPRLSNAQATEILKSEYIILAQAKNKESDKQEQEEEDEDDEDC